jgi:hypothetical protein
MVSLFDYFETCQFAQILTSVSGFKALLHLFHLRILPHQLAGQFFPLLFHFPQFPIFSKIHQMKFQFILIDCMIDSKMKLLLHGDEIGPYLSQLFSDRFLGLDL